jgi:hypothetical protein
MDELTKTEDLSKQLSTASVAQLMSGHLLKTYICTLIYDKEVMPLDAPKPQIFLLRRFLHCELTTGPF